MSNRRKNNKKPGKAGRIALHCFAALLLAILALAGIGAINAGVVRVRRAEVRLGDLPATFDGVTLLYATDIDLMGLNTPEKSGALFQRLQALKPDVLLLGGDYTSPSLLEILNRGDDAGNDRQARTNFFQYIASFDAPLGKYAVAAPEDSDRQELAAVMRQAGVAPLFNDRAFLTRASDAIWIAGICEDGVGLNSAGTSFSNGECVIVAAYGPDALPVLLTSEAADGGQWADAILCGHTHGGQVRLFGRSALPLSRQEQRYLSGWDTESNLPILTSQGVGCEGLNIRLGTRPEVWLITLRRA